MYAIFQAKGKQFRADPDATLRLPSLEAQPGETVTFDEVLLAERDGRILIGRPAVAGASVAAEVLRHGKGDKIVVFKMKRRKGYRRKQGHRQRFTEVRVVKIDLGDGRAAKRAAKARVKEEMPEPPAAAEAPAAAAEILATDSARALAEEHGIDLAAIDGTGKDRRILKGDVEKAIKEREARD
ncbi:MAG: 50S ribosomal protein L21 [Gemmatimonadota bacterium]